MSENEKPSDIAGLTVQLLSAYLANNVIAAEDLAGLIRSTKAALTEDQAAAPSDDQASTYTPAVSLRKSQASPDNLISMIDGKPYKTLKRHLAKHGLTPEEYRERYKLPAGYPMVAPSFAARRREIAEKIGLGRKGTGVAASVPATSPVTESAPKTDASSAAEAPKARTKTAGTKLAKPANSKPKAPSKARDSASQAAVKGPVGPKDVSSPAAIPEEAPAQSSVRRERKMGGAKPAKKVEHKTAKAPVRKRKELETRVGTAASASEGGSDPEADMKKPAATKSAGRRGKLGLFGKGTADTTAAAQEPTPSVKPGRKPRMARTPKPTPSAAAGEPDTTTDGE